jgi:hypothetical protein
MSTTPAPTVEFRKDPDAIVDFQWNWSDYLDYFDDGDTIDSSDWLVPPGIAKADESHTGSTATIWLEGGTVGKTYRVTNRITTVGGRTDDRTRSIRVVDR